MSHFFSRVNSARLVLLFFMAHAMDERLLHAQAYLTTFGRVLDLPTGQPEARSLMAADFNGDGKIDIAWAMESQIVVRRQGENALHWHSVDEVAVGRPIRFAAAARLNRDRFADLVVVTDDPPEIRTYLGRRTRVFSAGWREILSEPFEKMLVADVNNDRKADILLFGKKHLGLGVWLGRGDGSFRHSENLFEEYSISALAVADMNGDGIADVIGADWISNRVLVFTGFGKMAFSDPAVIPCPDEPSFLATPFLNSDVNCDLLIGSAGKSAFTAYTGDGLGRFHLSQTIRLDEPLTGLASADMNGDRRADAVILTIRGVGVSLNDGTGSLAEPESFAAGGGNAPVEFTFMEDSLRHCASVAVLDSAQIRLFLSARLALPSQRDDAYGIGRKPSGIITADVNHDGWPDIVAADEGSRGLSLFLGSAGGALNGQVSFRTGSPVQSVRYLPRNDTMFTLIGFSDAADSMAIVDVSARTFSHTVTTLPTQGPVELLSERRDSSSGYLRLFALEHDREGATPVEYEQITSSRFIERSFSSLTRPAPVSGTLTDLDGDGVRDFAFLAPDEARRGLDLFLARGKNAEQFYPPRLMFTLDAPPQTRAMLWSTDLTGDRIPDLVINLQEPKNLLLVALGSPDTTFSPPLESQVPSVALSSRDDLQFIDLNHDGMTDIIVNNRLKRLLQLYAGQGNGRFVAGTKYMSTDGFGGFDLAEVQAGGTIPYLFYTEPDKGLLHVVNLEGGR